MPATRTCDFSGDEIEPGTGIVYVRNDGTILTFKDSKAEKNYFLGREGRTTEWTSIAHEGDEGADAERPDSDTETTDTAAAGTAGGDTTESGPSEAAGGLSETLEDVEESGGGANAGAEPRGDSGEESLQDSDEESGEDSDEESGEDSGEASSQEATAVENGDPAEAEE